MAKQSGKKRRSNKKNKGLNADKSRSKRPQTQTKRGVHQNPLIWIAAVLSVGSIFYFSLYTQSQPDAPVLSPEIVGTFPHDTTAFTQGLLIQDGELFESTGQYGKSTVRKLDLRTGTSKQIHTLDSLYFGEGLAALDGRLYQLTWKEGKCFVYDIKSLAPVDTLVIPTREGWGLTEDGTHLIMSDGSSLLRYLDPETLEIVRQIDVRNGDDPVSQLNELEYIEGLIYANVWQSGYIAVIDPEDGVVKRFLDLRWFSTSHGIDGADVLNGIAYEPSTQRLLVTGKFWDKFYVLELPAIK